MCHVTSMHVSRDQHAARDQHMSRDQDNDASDDELEPQRLELLETAKKAARECRNGHKVAHKFILNMR